MAPGIEGKVFMKLRFIRSDEGSSVSKPKTMSADALDFAPGLLSIQESPPAKLPRALMYMVVVLFSLLLLWALVGKLDIVARAEGRLVPQTYVKIVQPADAGIVQEIVVKEGERVKAGQILMRMNALDARADERSLQSQLALRSLQLRRIDAELGDAPLIQKPGEPVDLFRQVSSQYRERKQAHLDALGQSEEGYRKAQRDYDAGREILTKLREVLPILKEQASSYADLGKEGYVSMPAVRDKQREFLEKSQDLRSQEANVASLQAVVAQARQQLKELSSRYRSELQNERIEAQGQYQKLEQDLVKQEHKNALLELRAPQAGIVKDLATHTAGAVVSPGTVLLSIVPEDEPLVAEVMIKNDDVGFVMLNQAVKIKLQAYPFEQYGLLDGYVRHIGPDSAESQGVSGKDGNTKDLIPSAPSYKAIVELHSQTLQAQNERLKLMPGMQVVAEIKQGRRTVMEYLLSPVRKAIHESGTER